MGNYLYGEKLSTTYKQVVAIGGTDDRVGIHATTQKALWTDDGSGGANAFPITAAEDALQFTTDKRLEFRADSQYIYSSAAGKLDMAATTWIKLASAEVELAPTGTAGLDVNSSGAITLDATSQNSNFTVTGANLTLSTSSSGEIFLTPVTYIQVASGKKLQFADSGEYVSGDGTNLTIGSGADILLTATNDINIPANVGLVFDSNDSEKIESNDTDLTISSGGKINLTATTDVVIPTNVGLQFTDANEKIESDGTDLTVNSGRHINLTAGSGGDIYLPNDVGLIFGDAGEKIEGDGTDLSISSSGNLNLTSTVNEASAIYVRANGGSSETIKIHSDQGTSVTEGAASVSLLSDAGGVELRSTADLANAINLTVDGGTTSSMTLYNDQGTSVTEGSASIQLLSDAGGIGIKSTANLASAILLTADGGTSETIKIHADQGTSESSIELTSDAGGVDINVASGKTFAVDAGIVSIDSTANSNLTMTANTGSTQTLTISALNSDGSNVGDLLLNADGQVHIRSDITTNSYAGAGIQIGTDLSGVDVAIGHTTSDVRIGDNLLVTGDGTVSGNLTVTGTLSYGAAALSNQAITGTSPYLTFTNTEHENSAMDDTSDNATGRESKILFKGEKADGTAHELATIQAGHEGTGNDYKGQIQFFTNSGALSDGALALAMTIADTGYVGIGTATPECNLHILGDDAHLHVEDASAGGEVKLQLTRGSVNWELINNADFHIEYEASKLMTIKESGNIGIGVDAPLGKLHIESSSAGAIAANAVADELLLESSGHTGMTIYSGTGSTGNIQFGDADDDDIGKIEYDHNTNNMAFVANGGTKMTILDTGEVGIGTSAPAQQLQIQSGNILLAQIASGAGTQKVMWSAQDNSERAYIGYKIHATATSDSGIEYSTAYGNHTFKGAGGATLMTIDAYDTGIGNVGIGTATPQSFLDIQKSSASTWDNEELISNYNLILRNSNTGTNTYAGIAFDVSTETDDLDAIGAGIACLREAGASSTATNHHADLLFATNNASDDGLTEKMRIKADGKVGIGSSDPAANLEVWASAPSSDPGLRVWNGGGTVSSSYVLADLDYSGDPDVTGAYYLKFQDQGGEIGSIKSDGTGIDFNQTSDYRLKEDLKPVSDAIGTINKLNIYDFKWKKTGRRMDGLLAHEVMEVVPYCASGEKDAMTTKQYVDVDGETKTKEVIHPQSVNYSKLVPLLVKSIQELSAKVEALEKK